MSNKDDYIEELAVKLQRAQIELATARERAEDYRASLSALALYLSVGSGDETTTAKEYHDRIHDGISFLTEKLSEQLAAERERANNAEEALTAIYMTARADAKEELLEKIIRAEENERITQDFLDECTRQRDAALANVAKLREALERAKPFVARDESDKADEVFAAIDAVLEETGMSELPVSVLKDQITHLQEANKNQKDALVMMRDDNDKLRADLAAERERADEFAKLVQSFAAEERPQFVVDLGCERDQAIKDRDKAMSERDAALANVAKLRETLREAYVHVAENCDWSLRNRIDAVFSETGE